MIVPTLRIFVVAIILLVFATVYLTFFTNKGKNISGSVKFFIIFFGSPLGAALVMLLVLATTNGITIVQKGGTHANINIWGDYTVKDDDGNTIVELVNLDLFKNYIYNGTGKKLMQYPVVYSQDGNSTTDKLPLFYDDGKLSRREHNIDYYFTIAPDSLIIEKRKSNKFLINIIESVVDGFSDDNETKWVLDYVTEGDIPFSIRVASLEKIIEELNRNCPIAVLEGCTLTRISEDGDSLIYNYLLDEKCPITIKEDFLKDSFSHLQNNLLLNSLFKEYCECERSVVMVFEQLGSTEVQRIAIDKKELKKYLE